MIILEVVKSEWGKVVIASAKSTGAVLYLQSGSCQSEADEHGISYAPYIHAMFDMVMQSGAVNILMIGCGGGTLATMLVRASRNVTVVDVNPIAFEMARKYFSLNDEVSCHVADGLSWIQRSTDKFDCIVVDAFQNGEIPSHLCSSQFFGEVQKHLTDAGIVLLNVIESTDELDYTYSIVCAMSQIGLSTSVLEEAQTFDRNVILLGGAINDLTTPKMRMPPKFAAGWLSSHLDSMHFRELSP